MRRVSKNLGQGLGMEKRSGKSNQRIRGIKPSATPRLLASLQSWQNYSLSHGDENAI